MRNFAGHRRNRGAPKPGIGSRIYAAVVGVFVVLVGFFYKRGGRETILGLLGDGRLVFFIGSYLRANLKIYF
jgi:hypothetical protein